jgi:hypothetical protein
LFTDSTSTTSTANYTRIITLHHNGSANGTMLATFEDNVTGTEGVFPIYRSTNNGTTWTFVTNVTDTHYGYGNRQEPALYELPEQVGSLPAGTILLAGNVEPQNQSSTNLVLYVSTDQGSTWSYQSTIDTGGPAVYCPYPVPATTSECPDGESSAVWEPALTVDSSGNLVVFYSDEREKEGCTPPDCILQAVVERISTDGGLTWGSESNVVADPDNDHRPGMFSVTQLPNGTYFAVYEVVSGAGSTVPIYSRTSTNGDDWGTASDLGTELESTVGTTLFGAPQVTWSPAGGPDGTLIVNALADTTSIGTFKSDFFTNTDYGSGEWTQLPAPIDVDGGYPNGALSDLPDLSNYSAQTAVSEDGQTLVELTSEAVSSTQHEVISNTMPLYTESYAAANAVLSNDETVSRPAMYDGEDVGYINYSDSTVNFDDVYAPAAGTYDVRVYYSNGTGAASSQNVSVNGGTAFSLSEPPTVDWGHGAWTDFTAALSAGTNSIEFSYSGTYAELNMIQVWSPSTRYEASQATLSNDSLIARPNASDGEHVGYINYSDSTVTFSNVTVPSAGEYTVTISYSADYDNDPGVQSLTVNGGSPVTVNYPITGDWDTDGTVNEQVSLSAGTNTLQFAYDGGFAELDCIDVSQPV